MSFKNSENGNKSSHTHGVHKHLLHMIVCCGLPMIIIFFLPYIASLSPSFALVLGRLAPFICPLMMFLMVPMMMMGNKKKSCCQEVDKKEAVDLKNTGK